MRLIKARVRGFQSFSDSGEVTFSEGINLIIGQNNAGKSAFLRALLPALSDDRHRTPEKWDASRLLQPTVDLVLDTSGAEIYDAVLRSGTQQYFPITKQHARAPKAFMQEFFERPHLTVSVTHTSGINFAASYPSHQLFSLDSDGDTQKMCALVTPISGEVVIDISAPGGDSLPQLLLWRGRCHHPGSESWRGSRASPDRCRVFIP